MVNFWRTTLSCILGTLFLAVDGLDFRQWCNGDDCGSDVTGNAFAESTHGGDRLYLRDAGRAAVRAALLFGDYPNTQQSMLLLCISLAVLGFFLGIEVQKRRLGSMGHWPAP